ncbi:MAG: hypothetical protein U0168_27885 [Nannocystaceae bacterium]
MMSCSDGGEPLPEPVTIDIAAPDVPPSAVPVAGEAIDAAVFAHRGLRPARGSRGVDFFVLRTGGAIRLAGGHGQEAPWTPMGTTDDFLDAVVDRQPRRRLPRCGRGLRTERFPRYALEFTDAAVDYGPVLDHTRLDTSAYSFLVGCAVAAPPPRTPVGCA